MKRLIIIATASLLLAACAKEDDTLVETSWGWSSDSQSTVYEAGESITINTLSVGIQFDTPTHGHAYIHDNRKIYGYEFSYYAVYDVHYTYNEKDNKGSITFTKEYHENNGQFYESWYSDTVTTSFYTYAGNNRIFLDSTPHKHIQHVDLNKKDNLYSY